jgi:hypothetical protein
VGLQPCHLHVPIVLKSESLNLLEPSGPVKACNGIALPSTFLWQVLWKIAHALPVIYRYNLNYLQRWKLKFSLSIAWRHTYRGSRAVDFTIVNLSTWWRWVVTFTPGPLYLWERTLCQFNRRLGRPPDQVWMFWRRETCLALDGIGTPDRSARSIVRSVNRSLNSYTDGGEPSGSS